MLNLGKLYHGERPWAAGVLESAVPAKHHEATSIHPEGLLSSLLAEHTDQPHRLCCAVQPWEGLVVLKRRATNKLLSSLVLISSIRSTVLHDTLGTRQRTHELLMHGQVASSQWAAPGGACAQHPAQHPPSGACVPFILHLPWGRRK